MLPKNLKIKPEFKANIYAHAICFLLNIIGYTLTDSFFFIWIEIACSCFIGYHNAKSPTFFDRNILNHFITVISFYFLTYLIGDNDSLYIILIFTFTYFYFILKDNGFNKSNQLWMYIQALLIGTTFVSFPFSEKIYATVIGYIEAQLILNLAFTFFSNNEQHEAEKKYFDAFKISWQDWFDINHNPSVKLAIRGAVTAMLLYGACSNFHDIKPNWAVATAISCLQRDDNDGSMRAIKGITAGSLIGWPLEVGIISILGHHDILATLLLWGFMIVALALSLEQLKSPTLSRQIAITIFFLITTTCLAIGMQSSSYTYLHLKIINSVIGAGGAFIMLNIWKKLHKSV